MLECGLALTAACLPPTSYLFTHMDVKSFFNNLRGILTTRRSHSLRNPLMKRQSSKVGYNQRGLHNQIGKDLTASRVQILCPPPLKLKDRDHVDLEVGLPESGAAHTPPFM